MSQSSPNPVASSSANDAESPASPGGGSVDASARERLSQDDAGDPRFTGAEIGALAHLYRGEVYRSTIWRTRLDATTNWSVVSLGIALSLSYSTPNASPLPLLLVGILIIVFLFLEARRYRYFNVWRARARWMEIHFYSPLLKREPYQNAGAWQSELAGDYERPDHHISFARAFGRRLRRNYQWIFLVQGLAFFGKAAIHPTPATSLSEMFARMAIGPAPGVVVGGVVLAFHALMAAFTIRIYVLDRRRFKERPNPISMG
ncbi:MAG: DUF2270 domain-containing protein [Pseudomonadota bacterium]